MRAFASAEFSASHQVPGHPVCGRLHGHRWRVTVTIGAGQDPATGILVGSYELAAAVRGFAAELELDDIGAMLPGRQATAEGIAAALRERLTMTFAVETIEVSMDGGQGIIL